MDTVSPTWQLLLLFYFFFTSGHQTVSNCFLFLPHFFLPLLISDIDTLLPLFCLMMYMSKQTTFQSSLWMNGGGCKPAAVSLWNIEIRNPEYEHNGNCPIKTEASSNWYKVGSVFCDKGSWSFTIYHFNHLKKIVMVFQVLLSVLVV